MRVGMALSIRGQNWGNLREMGHSVVSGTVLQASQLFPHLNHRRITEKEHQDPTLWEAARRKKCVFLYPGWKTEFLRAATIFHH